jgi:glucose-6-phosphate isomerase
VTQTRVEIEDPRLIELAAAATTQLVQAGVPARLAARDPGLWGPDAAAEASIRLGWLDLPTSSRALLSRLDALRAEVRADGVDHVVLAGMGGSSLAPEVICRTARVELTVLDTTDPEQVARAVSDRLDRTVVVVASKSGTTIETDSHRRVYEHAFRAAGLDDAAVARRFVVVTDPGTPLERYAREAGYHLVLADPNVGGRYSALSAFGLVPSALAGADVASVLDAAAGLADALRDGADNPGLLLGAALGAAADGGRDKLVLAAADPEFAGLPDWIEQLIAESTGKQGRGILPVVVDGTADPGWSGAGPDTVRVALGSGANDLAVSGPLGALFLLWEYATAVAGMLLEINPFDQPNVAESKENTAALLDRLATGTALPVGEPLCVDDSVAIYGDAAQFPSVADLPGALAALATATPLGGYLAIMAYLDRHGQAEAARLRPVLAGRLFGRMVTFGWGPRFLHSTGQYHKGGPPVGSFVQVTGEPAMDVPIPDRPFRFGALQLAQALGDLGALTSRGRTVLRLHLLDRAKGLAQLLAAADELAAGTEVER